jgi:hypothetical protein
MEMLIAVQQQRISLLHLCLKLLFQVKPLAEPKSIGSVAIPGSTLVKLLVRWTARINSASKRDKNSDAAQDLLGMWMSQHITFTTLH